MWLWLNWGYIFKIDLTGYTDRQTVGMRQRDKPRVLVWVIGDIGVVETENCTYNEYKIINESKVWR